MFIMDGHSIEFIKHIILCIEIDNYNNIGT